MSGNRDSDRETVTGCGGVTAVTADFFKLSSHFRTVSS